MEKCKRFIHVASYYLPIKPINNKILLSQEQFQELQTSISDISYTKIPNNYYLIKATDKLIKDLDILYSKTPIIIKKIK